MFIYDFQENRHSTCKTNPFIARECFGGKTTDFFPTRPQRTISTLVPSQSQFRLLSGLFQVLHYASTIMQRLMQRHMASAVHAASQAPKDTRSGRGNKHFKVFAHSHRFSFSSQRYVMIDSCSLKDRTQVHAAVAGSKERKATRFRQMPYRTTSAHGYFLAFIKAVALRQGSVKGGTVSSH